MAVRSRRFSPLLGQKTGASIEDFIVIFEGETIRVEARRSACLQGQLLVGAKAGIDFKITPAANVPADAYSGSLVILAKTSPGLGSGQCR